MAPPSPIPSSDQFKIRTGVAPLAGSRPASAVRHGFLVTFTSTPIYRAAATIQVDLAAAKVEVDTPDSSPHRPARFIKRKGSYCSRSLAERVVQFDS
jgi:hypothetical protein